METIIFAAVIIALAGGAIWFYNRGARSLDVNQDGKIDVKDAVEATKNAAKGVIQDSRDAHDAALAAVAESAGKIESAARRAKTAAKKAATRSTTKTATKKPAAKPRAKK
jgi:hypothetical protein